jgi:hypothetical protein
MKNTKHIHINYNDIKSIKKAEIKKTKLENSGYMLVGSSSSLNMAYLTYYKK